MRTALLRTGPASLRIGKLCEIVLALIPPRPDLLIEASGKDNI
jgi:hypothetical protein